MKNDWLQPKIEELENRKFHGKVQLNFKQGDVSAIQVEETVSKPKDIDRELE